MVSLRQKTVKRVSFKKRPVVIALVTVALGYVAALAFAFLVDAKKVPAHYQDTPERQSYEAALMADPGRVEATFGTIVDDVTGKLHTAHLNDPGMCRQRCMTVKAVDGGYAVRLPVAYVDTAATKSFTAPYEPGNIIELTYWDPVAHQPRTVTAPPGDSVMLPEVFRSRKLDSMKRGETMYVSPYMVRRGTDERVRVLGNVSVFYEPGGSRYGMIDLARLTRTSDGFVACLPAGYELLGDEVMSSPYMATLEVGC